MSQVLITSINGAAFKHEAITKRSNSKVLITSINGAAFKHDIRRNCLPYKGFNHLHKRCCLQTKNSMKICLIMSVLITSINGAAFKQINQVKQPRIYRFNHLHKRCCLQTFWDDGVSWLFVLITSINGAAFKRNLYSFWSK